MGGVPQCFEYTCQGSEYGKVVNMGWLRRMLNMSEYALTMPQYASICLNNVELT